MCVCTCRPLSAHGGSSRHTQNYFLPPSSCFFFLFLFVLCAGASTRASHTKHTTTELGHLGHRTLCQQGLKEASLAQQGALLTSETCSLPLASLKDSAQQSSALNQEAKETREK